MLLRAFIAAVIAVTISAGDVDARARKGKRAAPAASQSQVVKDDGPDLKWPCWVIRFNAKARGFTYPLTPTMKREVARLEKQHGITPKQHRQAEACFDVKT